MSSLIRASLARPYTVTVGALAVVVLGVLCASSIPIDILPVNHTPAVQVLTFYGGMPAEAIEKNITTRLERQTGQASGRLRQESRSIQGASIVRNYFAGGVDPNNALAQVNSLATAAAKNMPPGTDPPVILPFDPTGTTPVCVVALDSPTHSEATLYDVGRYEVRNMIMGMPGANAPAVHGGRLRAILAYLDRHQLEARGLSPLDVMQALDEYNLFLPTGDARFGGIDYAIDSNAMFRTVEDMGDIPLRTEAGNATFLRDVATPTDASFMQTSLVRVDGRRQVYIPVYRQAGASTLEVVDRLKASVGDMQERLSQGEIDLKVVMDQSVYVRHSIASLVEEGLLGAAMCSLVILLFLGNLRMTGIAVVTIPLSVLAAVAALHAAGHTINIMTLAGLALAIGPLVDLAVIVLESTHRRLAAGDTPRLAALHGTAEVATPALVATLCTLLVLAPLAFLPDLGEFLFRPMALAVAFAMLAAFVLSQTFVPARCAAWLKPHHAHERRLNPGRAARLFARWEAALERATDWYVARLAVLVRRPGLIVLLAVATLGTAVLGLGPQLRREFFPEVDAGAFEMTVRGPTGTRLEVTEQRVAQVEQLIRETLGDDLELIIAELGVVPDWSAAYTPNAGPMDAALKVQLTPHRRRSAQEAVRALRAALAADGRFADLEYGFDTGGLIRTAMNGGKSTPINIRVTGKDLARSRRIAEAMRQEVVTVEGVVDARILQRLDYPQYTIDIDRAKAADLGLSLPYVMKNVVAALNSSVQFHKKNFFIDPRSKSQYYVGVQYPESDIESVETLLDIPITSPAQQQPIPLRNLVTLRRTSVPTEVVHHEVQPAVELVMAVDGRDLGHVAEDVARVVGRFGEAQPDGSWRAFDPDAPETDAAPVGRESLEPGTLASAGLPGARPAGGTRPTVAPTRPVLAGTRIELGGEFGRMQDMFQNLGGGLLLAALLVYFLLVSLFQSFRLPLAILGAVPLGLIGVVAMLYLTETAINVQSLLGVIFLVGIVVANTVLLVDCAQTIRRDRGVTAARAILAAAQVRMRPVVMTALAALLALLPMALALARGSEANAPLGRAVVGGLLAGLVTTLFVVPCLYVLLVGEGDEDTPEVEAAG
ncbi:MAG TPA: efflux RND transporter permease subunit [Planctomycetaceae bacterium]|nr:efflux RND transporter permease subunit [Planctomycetaceae bacterium]